MRILSFTFETTLRLSETVTEHAFALRCAPLSDAGQTVLSRQTIITPTAGIAEQVDGFGNLLQIGRVAAEHDTFDFASSGMVMSDHDDPSPSPAHPVYSRPSRFTDAGEAVAALVSEVGAGTFDKLVGAAAWKTAAALSEAIADRMAYEPGSTDVTTTAAEALALGKGVCQDYAHILIAACRTAGIPARYVSGLMVGEGATHAWVEIHDGARWLGLDPTHACIVDDRYIAIARGRDFGDCPIECGVFLGTATQEQEVRVLVVDNEQR